MDLTPYVPVLVEATKFVFDEIGKWIDDVRKRSKKSLSQSIETADDSTPKLTEQEFSILAENPQRFEAAIDAQLARTNVYVIQGLVKQIQVHRRNLVDYEGAEAEFGVLTPPHIKRGIEHESDALIEKSGILKDLLEKIYGRRFENV